MIKKFLETIKDKEQLLEFLRKNKIVIGVVFAIILIVILIYIFTGGEKVKVHSNYFENERGIYYREKNGRFYKRLWGMDKESFQALSTVYSRDEDSIYFKNTKMRGLDIDSYKVLGNYVKDEEKVYYGNDRMRGVEAKFFRVLGAGYARDNENIFYLDKKLKDVDYKSFVAMESGYARDLNSIFYHENVIEGVDIETFRLIDPVFSKDKNNCYEQGKRVKMNECKELIK